MVDMASVVVLPLELEPHTPSKVVPLAWDPVVLVPAMPLELPLPLVPQEFNKLSLVEFSEEGPTSDPQKDPRLMLDPKPAHQTS